MKGDGALAAVVWLPRSTILLNGMTDDGAVRSVDEEDGVRIGHKTHWLAGGGGTSVVLVALGGSASIGGSSVARRSSVRSWWGEAEVEGGAETWTAVRRRCWRHALTSVNYGLGERMGEGWDVEWIWQRQGGGDMGGMRDFWIRPVQSVGWINWL
jgi:hypothetical protein